MPIRPAVDWDQPTNVALDKNEREWRHNHWVDKSVTDANENLPLLNTKYNELWKKLCEIE